MNIHIEPAREQRRAFALWALSQTPKLQTSSSTGTDVPVDLFPDVPPELLEGAYVDGFPYGGPSAPQPKLAPAEKAAPAAPKPARKPRKRAARKPRAAASEPGKLTAEVAAAVSSEATSEADSPA
jgi:hypothetical protein